LIVLLTNNHVDSGKTLKAYVNWSPVQIKWRMFQYTTLGDQT